VSVTGPEPCTRDCCAGGTEMFCGSGANRGKAIGSDVAPPFVTVMVAIPPLARRLAAAVALAVGTPEGLLKEVANGWPFQRIWEFWPMMKGGVAELMAVMLIGNEVV